MINVIEIYKNLWLTSRPKDDILDDIGGDMVTSEDVKRVMGDTNTLRLKMDKLANACKTAPNNEMKKIWFDHLGKFAKKFNMMDYYKRLID